MKDLKHVRLFENFQIINESIDIYEDDINTLKNDIEDSYQVTDVDYYGSDDTINIDITANDEETLREIEDIYHFDDSYIDQGGDDYTLKVTLYPDIYF
jgi:hypothetical protein